MKTSVRIITGLVGLLVISGCTTVEQAEPASRTSITTTEQSTVRSPLYNTVETQTTRRY